MNRTQRRAYGTQEGLRDAKARLVPSRCVLGTWVPV